MTFRKNITFHFLFLGTLALASHAQARSVDVRNLIDAVQSSESNTPELAAALMMIDLYDQGLAGDKTGLCVDFDQTAGKPSIKVGFSTSAFVTGKDGMSDVLLQADADRLKKLISTLAKAQGGSVNAKIVGYADGQHYKSGKNFSIDESIAKNEALSKQRAKSIEGFLSEISLDQGKLVTTTDGFASPEWERNKKYAGQYSGLDCPTRRKVVITLDAPEAQVKEVVSPVRRFIPDEMEEGLKQSANRLLKMEIGSINSRIDHGSIKDRADQIYAELKQRNSIVPECDREPMKQLTLAYIASSIDNDDKKNLQDWIAKYLKAPYRAYQPEDNARGMGTFAIGCVRPKENWMQSMIEQSPNFQTSAKDFFGIGSNTNVVGTATVQFDSSLLKEERITKGAYAGAERSDGRHAGTMQRGYFCKACGSGWYFHRDAQGNETIDYQDRAFRSNDPNRSPAAVLNEMGDANPFSVAGFMKPRLYVVKNCKGLSTAEIMDRIQKKDPSVSSVDPLENRSALKMKSADLEGACVIRPPLMHTCSATQNHQHNEEDAKVSRSFQYTDLAGVSRTASSLNELLNSTPSACVDNRMLSPQEKINRVSCSTDALRKLPTGNEKADCAEFVKGI
jgi:hypothetical protein